MSGTQRIFLTTAEKAQINTLSADGWSLKRIARLLNRNRATVRRYLNEPEAIVQVRDEKQELAVLYREKARACVVAIDDEKIAKASALQLATASGICMDKALLLSGQPTVNVAVLLEICEVIRAEDKAESEHQHQPAKALLGLPASQP